jgi:hypothetical protein
VINKPEGYTVAVDVAYSDDKPMNYRAIKDAGVDLLIFKGGQFKIDPLAERHAKGALDAGLLLAAYWYVQIDGDIGYQSRLFESIAKKYPLRFVAPDIEQEEGYVPNGKKRGKYVKYSSKQINNSAWAITQYINKWRNCELLEYTRTSYIYDFCPQLDDWIINYPLWLAQYLYTKNKNGDLGEWVYTCDKALATLKGFTYCPTWEEYFELYAPKPNRSISLPNGATDWKIWQFTGDHVQLPGCGSSIDINWVKSDWLFGVEIPNPPPVPPIINNGILYKGQVNTSGLTVRNKAMVSGGFVRYLVHNNIVDVYEIFSNGWVRIGDNEYVNGKYLDKVI